MITDIIVGAIIFIVGYIVGVVTVIVVKIARRQ